MSAQLIALFENNAALAIENATRANAMAKLLYDGVVQIAAENPRVTVPNPAEANAVFPVLPESVTQELQQKYRFYVWDQVTGQVRWMCSWDTTEDDVTGMLAALRAAL
jgi:threonine aldolase